MRLLVDDCSRKFNERFMSEPNEHVHRHFGNRFFCLRATLSIRKNFATALNQYDGLAHLQRKTILRYEPGKKGSDRGGG